MVQPHFEKSVNSLKSKLARMSTKPPRLAIFVDGANIDTPAREANLRINYARFRAYLVGSRNLVSATFYESRTANLGKRAFYSDVKKAGFVLKLGPYVLYEEKQKEIDVQIAVDAVSGAYENQFDIAVLGSGDGDMAPIVRKLKSMGKEVEVASFNDRGQGKKSQLAWSLKTEATRIRDLTYDIRKIT
ncbi:MAG: NYN domain-containing protein [Candidatus Bathyarchaeia archaeon]